MPNLTYKLKKVMSTNMVIDVKGKQPKTKKKTVHLVKNSNTIEMEMNTDMVITTGAESHEKVFPLKFNFVNEILKMTMNKQPIPIGAASRTTFVIYGKSNEDGNFTIDSIAGKLATDSLKTAMLKMFSAIHDAVKFPDKALKVGDTFTQEVPFDMPLAGLNNVKISVKCVYKLLSMDMTKAQFGLVETMTMQMDQRIKQTDMKMNMQGTGTGKITYDMKMDFFNSMTNNLQMNYNMLIGGMSMTGKGFVKSVDDYSISTN